MWTNLPSLSSAAPVQSLASLGGDGVVFTVAPTCLGADTNVFAMNLVPLGADTVVLTTTPASLDVDTIVFQIPLYFQHIWNPGCRYWHIYSESFTLLVGANAVGFTTNLA